MLGTVKSALALLLILIPAYRAAAQAKVDRENDKLIGVVRSVRVEYAHLFDREGRQFEGRRIPRTETIYNVEGRMIERVNLKLDGSVEGKTGYTYDDSGRLAEMTYYDSDGAASSKDVYGYDDSGRLVYISIYESDGSISSKWGYTYNADGSLLRRSEYRYDGGGRISEREDYKADGSRDGRYVYKYDAEGNLKKIARDKTKYIYCGAIYVEEELTPVEYDSNGNWTKALGAGSVTYRTVTYH